MKKGKKILKSKTPKINFDYFFIIFAGILIIPTISFKIIEIINPPYRFTFNPIDFFSIFLGILCLLLGMMIFLSYVVVYENGVKVRKSPNMAEFLSYLIPKFILFEQIEEVNIENINLSKNLSIQLKEDVFSIEIFWILNYQDIERELTNRILAQKKKLKPIEKPEGTTKITFIKQNREFYGRYMEPPKWMFPEDGKIQLNCYGDGSIQDPITIDNSLHLPKRVSIKDYNLHFNFTDLQLIKIYLENCENFTFYNSEIDLIRMSSCSNINFIECSIPRDLKLKECQNITFKKCLIQKAIVFKSNYIVIKDCLIIRLSDWMSKNNKYESNKIKELRTNVKQETYDKRNSLSNNEIKKKQFRLKKLFPTGFKVLITDKIFCFSMIFAVLYCVCLLLILDSYLKGYDLGLLGIVYPYSFFILIIWLFIMAAIIEYYYKFKFKIIKKVNQTNQE